MATIGELTNRQPRCVHCNKILNDKAREKGFTTCYDCGQKTKTAVANTSGVNAQPTEQNRYSEYLKRLNDSEGHYFDERGNLRVELRVNDAEMVAKELVYAGVTSGQLRRFFTMIRSLEQRLNNTRDFAALVPEIARLQPLVASLIGREQQENKRRRLFVLRDFIDTNAKLAQQNEKAFLQGFLPHFESVIAYFTFYKPK
jgi:CRISPR type III-A-associated protein Csm2